ncbi:hypothetical protein N7509_010539 [Penicillium cosmopolitanum]|uniref:Uncharacterized protein n=1 Tax=Penicillium cosmopolitanum TaxID=1131564 RepID=A0A9W9VRH6_9EURO|nr:uncharacterized protein N7509_010539 [Penicillium cosmopolitanum]KAJ5387998.1 hypothetical protein N7509_010539 [Penicillium cosmopolitanum]
MSDSIVHGLSSEINAYDHYTSLDETLGAPMSMDDLFKEFNWDKELDDLNLNTGAKESVFAPTSYMDGSLGSTVDPSKTITTKPSETLTIDPSKLMNSIEPSDTITIEPWKTIITEPLETTKGPSNTTKEASETPSISSPVTPDCSVPMPLPIPMPMHAFLKTLQEPVLPQSSCDLEEAFIHGQMSMFQERLAVIQKQKFQTKQGFQKQQQQEEEEEEEEEEGLQQRHELQKLQELQKRQEFQQRHGLQPPQRLQQQPCPYVPQEMPSSPPADLLDTPSDKWPL